MITANPEICQKSGKKSRKEKQLSAPRVSSSKTLDMSSLPSLTGSSLDDTIANFPIEDDQAEPFMIESDKSPLSPSNMNSLNEEISLKKGTLDGIFKESLPEVGIDMVAPSQPRFDSGSQVKNEPGKKENEGSSLNKEVNKSPRTRWGCIFTRSSRVIVKCDCAAAKCSFLDHASIMFFEQACFVFHL